jgi:hypothetical protein
MRNNELRTPFWQDALRALPAELRPRYVHQIEQAERWELRLDAAVESWSRAKAAFGRMFQAPRSAH